MIGEDMRVRLGSITLYPVKALDGVGVPSSRITARGILEHDRIYAIFRDDGKAVNGKREPRTHALRSTFDPGFREIRLRVEGDGAGEQFSLAEPERLNRWLSEYFGYAVALRHDPEAGFPDDREAFGPTVVSQSSHEAVRAWFPGLTLESVRRRFRANLELAGEGLPAFWEDGLYGAAGDLRPFEIGAVRLRAHNPCQRCPVPTRDPRTGEAIAGFQQEFMARRRESLPSWANSSRFNHFYRFAVNTSIEPTEAGKTLQVGDPVEVPIPQPA